MYRNMASALSTVIVSVFILALSAVAANAETINFGMGRVIDASNNPYTGTVAQFSPLLVKTFANNTTIINCIWAEKDVDETNNWRSIGVQVSQSRDYGQSWSNKTMLGTLDAIDEDGGGMSFKAEADSEGNICVASGNKYAVYDSCTDTVTATGYLYDGVDVDMNSGLVVAPDGTVFMMDGDYLYCLRQDGSWSRETQSLPYLNNPTLRVDRTASGNQCTLYLFGTGDVDGYGLNNDILLYKCVYTYSSHDVESGHDLAWDSSSTLVWDNSVGTVEYLSSNVGPSGKADIAFFMKAGKESNVYFARDEDGTFEIARVSKKMAEAMVEEYDSNNHRCGIFYDEDNPDDVFVSWAADTYPSVYDCYTFNHVAMSRDGGRSFGRNFRTDWGDFNVSCDDYPSTVAVKDGDDTYFVHVWQDDRNLVHPDPVGGEYEGVNPFVNHIYLALGRLYIEDPKVLIVDDDDSEMPLIGYNTHHIYHNWHNYEAWYAEALFVNGVPFDFYDRPGMDRLPTLNYLKFFDKVMWETGMESSKVGTATGNGSRDSLTTDEQELLAGYLDGGGKLFLSSQDFLLDVTAGLENEDPGDSLAVTNTFAGDYLSVTDVANAGIYDNTNVNPVDLSIFGSTEAAANMMEYTGSDPNTEDTLLLRFFDSIRPKHITFDQNEAASCMNVYEGGSLDVGIKKTANPYSLVFMAFPFETITGDGSAEFAMDNINGWLDDAQGSGLYKDPYKEVAGRIFNVGDVVYVSAWSDRVTTQKSLTATFIAPGDGPEDAIVVNESGNDVEFDLGNYTDKRMGTWSVDIALKEDGVVKYEISKTFDVGVTLMITNLKHLCTPLSDTYNIEFRAWDELAREEVVVKPYYYDLDNPSVMTRFQDTNQQDVEFVVDLSVDAVGWDDIALSEPLDISAVRDLLDQNPTNKYGIFLTVEAADQSDDTYAYACSAGAFYVRQIELKSLTSDVTSPQVMGASIAWTADAAGRSDYITYHFDRKGPDTGGAYVVEQSNSSNNYWSWTPDCSQVGTNYIKVVAHDTVFGTYDYLTATYVVESPEPLAVDSLTPDIASPQELGGSMTWTAAASGGSGVYEYEFSRKGPDTNNLYLSEREYSSSATWQWTPTSSEVGTNYIKVKVKDACNGSIVYTFVSFAIQYPPITINSLSASPASPQNYGTDVVWTTSASGGSGDLEYHYFRKGPDTNNLYLSEREYSSSASWTWTPTSSQVGANYIKVKVRNASAGASVETTSAFTVQ